jgi:hypothetical protein
MLEPETKLFVNVPDESEERVLHLAKVISTTGRTDVIELTERELHFEPDSFVQVFREIQRRFMQQPARVREVEVSDGRTVVTIEITGEPVPAESRECFRVSAMGADVRAQFGPEADCQVLDVSATGFSILASKSHALGSRVEVVLHFEGEDHRGSVVVQSARPLAADRQRYGVYCLEDKQARRGLNAALPSINLALQRQQLQRLAGYR